MEGFSCDSAGLRDGWRVILAQLGSLGDIWFRFLSTSMEGNVLDKLETS